MIEASRAAVALPLEVKGTLRPRHWPRLRRGELDQMALDWLDKPDNPAMSDWNLQSGDVYGGIALLNFHDLAYKFLLTCDFETWQPVTRHDQLADLTWLDT